MDTEIISLLKSTKPAERINGVKRLVASGHPDTVKILGSLYKKETDDQVRQVLAEAARSIKKKRATGEMVGIGGPNPAEAKEYLSRAMDYIVSFDNDEAWIWAKKAFRANPALAEDEYAVGVAAEITGVDRSIAVDTLMQGGGSIDVAEKPKRSEKRKVADGERVGWGKALAAVGVYSLLVALVIGLPIMIFGSVIAALVASFDPSYGVTGATFLYIGGGILLGALFAVFIGVLIQYAVIHFSATTFLGGEGYYTNLLWNMRIPLFAQFLIQIVITGIMITLLYSAFTNIDAAAFEYVQYTGDFTALMGEQQGLYSALNGINSLVSLGFLAWTFTIIGNTYKFGWVKGCLSVIISGIVMAVVACGCYFAIFTVAMSSFSQSSF